jgi:hypothetical protein
MSVSCGGLIISPEDLARIQAACRRRAAEPEAATSAKLRLSSELCYTCQVIRQEPEITVARQAHTRPEGNSKPWPHRYLFQVYTKMYKKFLLLEPIHSK